MTAPAGGLQESNDTGPVRPLMLSEQIRLQIADAVEILTDLGPFQEGTDPPAFQKANHLPYW